MKEIDFLPEWYKSGRRRQLSYQSQYLALAGIFVLMIVWNVFASRSISKARAMSAKMATEQSQAEHFSAQLVDLKNELRRFQNKSRSIERIDSKIDIASILAEISFLVDEKVILKKVEFKAEEFVKDDGSKSSSNSKAVIRAVPSKSGQEGNLPIGDVRFKVVIGGIASDASNVAALICKLEDSPYFSQIILAFSRNGQIGKSGDLLSVLNKNVADTRSRSAAGANTESKFQVTEFEINCYLANYQEQ